MSDTYEDLWTDFADNLETSKIISCLSGTVYRDYMRMVIIEHRKEYISDETILRALVKAYCVRKNITGIEN